MGTTSHIGTPPTGSGFPAAPALSAWPPGGPMNAPTPTPLRPLMLAVAVALCVALPACARDADAPAPAAAAAPAASASVAAAEPAAVAEATKEMSTPKGVTPEAKAVLDRMSAYMHGLNAF